MDLITQIRAATHATWPILSQIASVARLQLQTQDEATGAYAAACLRDLTDAALPLERVGRRVYLRDSPLYARELLRGAGAIWDPQARAWWVGTTRRGALEGVREDLIGIALQGAEIHPSWAVVVGRCTHRGRPARVLWAAGEVEADRREVLPVRSRRAPEPSPAALLCDLPGERTWRVPAGQIEGLRLYRQPRSIGSLEQYARTLAETGLPPARWGGPELECNECGARYEGPGYVEPGAMGCVRCA